MKDYICRDCKEDWFDPRDPYCPYCGSPWKIEDEGNKEFKEVQLE